VSVGASSGKDAVLEIKVPAGARVIARAVHGAVQVRRFHGTLDVTVVRQADHLPIGSGNAQISLETFSGEIVIGVLGRRGRE